MAGYLATKEETNVISDVVCFVERILNHFTFSYTFYRHLTRIHPPRNKKAPLVQGSSAASEGG